MRISCIPFLMQSPREIVHIRKIDFKMKYIQNTTSGFCILQPFNPFAMRVHLLYALSASFFIFLILLMCYYFRNEYNTSHLALSAILIYLSLYYFGNPFFFLKYLFPFSWCFFCLGGVYLCENTNFYLPEMGCDSGYAGSLPMACILFECFFFALFYADKYFLRKKKWKRLRHSSFFIDSHHHNVRLGLGICFFINVLLFLSVLNKPAFLLGCDRFTYAQFYLPEYVKQIFNFMQIFLPIMIVIYLNNSKKVNLWKFLHVVFTILPFFLLAIWIGNKFGVFFFFLLFAIIPNSALFQVSYDSRLTMIRRKVIRFIFLSSCILIPFFIITLSLQYKIYGKNLQEAIFDRAAQQGQLWWQLFQIENGNDSSHFDELADEILPIRDAILTNFWGYDLASKEQPGTFLNPNQPYGVYKLMEMTIPNSLYFSRLLSGSRYSAQGLELPFYYFKAFGAIFFLIVIAFLIAFFINQIAYSILFGKILYSIIFVKIFFNFYSAFMQGEWSTMFSKNVVFLIVLFCILRVIDFLCFQGRLPDSRHLVTLNSDL